MRNFVLPLLGEDRLPLPPQFRIERVPEAVAQQVEGEHHAHEGEAGDGEQVGRQRHVGARVGEHGPPFGGGRGHADAQKTQARRHADGGRDEEGRLHHDGAERPREDVQEQHAAARAADGLRRLHEFGLLQDEDRAAHQPGVGRDGEDAHRQHDVLHPRADDGDEQDGEQDAREGERDVHDPHDEVVDPAAQVSADEAEQHAPERGDQDGEHPDEQRGARAVDDAAEHVAPEMVRPERMGERGVLERRLKVRLRGVVGRDEGRQQGSAHEDRDENAAHHRDAVFEQTAESVRPHAADRRDFHLVARDGIDFGGRAHSLDPP